MCLCPFQLCCHSCYCSNLLKMAWIGNFSLCSFWVSAFGNFWVILGITSPNFFCVSVLCFVQLHWFLKVFTLVQLLFLTTLDTGLGLSEGWAVLGQCLLLPVLKKTATSASKIVWNFPKCFATLCVSSYPEVQRLELSDKVVLPSDNSSLMSLISLCPKLEVTFENRLLFVIISGFKWLKDILKFCLQDIIISVKTNQCGEQLPLTVQAFECLKLNTLIDTSSFEEWVAVSVL